jgi:hypothetical protein
MDGALGWMGQGLETREDTEMEFLARNRAWKNHGNGGGGVPRGLFHLLVPWTRGAGIKRLRFL